MGERTERSLVERALLMRDVMDGQLESSDRLRIGRVADVLVEGDGDASNAARVTAMIVGPEALGGRIHGRLRAALHRVLGGRFEKSVDVRELEELGPTLRLRRRAEAYSVASGERWIGENVVSRLPGAGRWPPPHAHAREAGRGERADRAEPAADGSRDPAPTLRGADLIGAHVVGPDGERLGEVLDVEVRPKEGFALDSVVVAREPALARLVLVRQVGPRPDGDHRLVPWRLVEAVDGRTIRLRALPPPEEHEPVSEATAHGQPEAAPGAAPKAEGEAHGASASSAVGERRRTEAPADEEAAEPARGERRARQ